MKTASPQWIARMYPGKPGRDHLGLGSVSTDQILPSLSPGINVLTHHPRYHSFYVFLLDEFWRSDRPRTHGEWVRFFRPREFIFSVGANLCSLPEHGEMSNIVGGQKTQPLANQNLELYDTTFHYIDSPLGGYGLYYRSVMAQLELIYPGGPGFPYPVDVPTDAGGKAVAAAFRQAVEATTYYREYFQCDNTQVPQGVVQEYIERACLCQLRKPGVPDRVLLVDRFLHRGADAVARRRTLRMFVDIAVQTNGHSINQDSFRQILYFGAADNGADYSPQEPCLDTYQKWRLYQAREYYDFALNALWCHLCEWGLDEGGDLRPIPLARLWDYLEGVLDWGPLATLCGVPSPGLGAHSRFEALLAWLRSLASASAQNVDELRNLDSPIHEHRLYSIILQSGGRDRQTVAHALTMLGMLALRFGRPALWLRGEWSIARMGDTARLSLHWFLESLNAPACQGKTIAEVARWLYLDYVILQHQLVANSKLPDNTFRFRREGDRLRFYNLENALAFMDSRFDALSTTVYELGLCGDLRQPGHPLTSDGQRLLEEGDLA